MTTEVTTVSNPFASTVSSSQGAAANAEQQRALADVQAALFMARSRPRDPVVAMDLILQDCARPSLAHDATYQYVRGGEDITGPSIRLAETMARRWGNIECGVKEISRMSGYSECLAYAWDLETNYREAKTFHVKHWRDTKKGGYVIKDERDIYEVVANQGARRKRACILAVIPSDVQDAAVKQCELTLKTKLEITDELISSLVESFNKVGVTKEQLEKRIQRRIDTITPTLVLGLKKIYNSIKDGMSTPADWFELATTEQTESSRDHLKKILRSRTSGDEKTDNRSSETDQTTGEITNAESPQEA